MTAEHWSSADTYPQIHDYAIIGDGQTAALITRDGSLDWLCLPRFDSPAVFCRLLDVSKGGCFRVAPVGEHQSSRAYMGRTNVLVTTFATSGGQIRLTDFMPVGAHPRESRILRLLEGVTGSTEVEIRFHPTFAYARHSAEITPYDGGVIATLPRGRDACAGVSGQIRTHGFRRGDSAACCDG